MMNKFEVKNMDLYYGSFHALKNINIAIPEKEITAFIGPSGCGKSTFLKSLNRMNDLVEGCRISGDILLDGVDIYKDKMDVNVLRKRVGMVFQKPNPFPMSIYDNIAYGPRTHGVRSKAQLDEIVEKSLRGAAIWDEVKDRLNKSALGMSGGQQQRLCIARALAVEPEAVSEGLAAFRGAGRRFEHKGTYHGAEVYDDYAHHPGELHALLSAARTLGYERVICAFQPHTYTRTHALFNDFVEALRAPDITLLAEIYAAREVNDIGISSKDLAARIPGSEYYATLPEVTERLRALARPGDLILTVGAGDIFTVGEALLREG